MTSNQDRLINHIIFDKEKSALHITKIHNDRTSSKSLQFKLYLRNNDKFFVFLKILVGLLTLAIPSALSTYFIQDSLTNFESSKSFVSALVFIISNSVIIVYIVLLIIFKILDLCSSRFVFY